MTAPTMKIPPKAICLMTVAPGAELTGTIFRVMRELFAGESSVVLVLSIRPSRTFASQAKESGLNIDTYLEQNRLVVVDCVSRLIGDRGGGMPNTLYVSAPSDLSELALSVSDAVSSVSLKGEKWLILDSVSTLTLYNTAGGVLRFLHFLASKMRVLEFGGVIIITRSAPSDPMVQALEQYCDLIISEQ